MYRNFTFINNIIYVGCTVSYNSKKKKKCHIFYIIEDKEDQEEVVVPTLEFGPELVVLLPQTVAPKL